MGNSNSVDLSKLSKADMNKILAVAKIFEKLNGNEQQVVEEEPEEEMEEELEEEQPKKSLNLFETSNIFNMHKADSKIDKKLWADRQPEPRTTTASRDIQITCRICNKEYTVSEKLMPPDPKRFTCDRCLGGRPNG